MLFQHPLALSFLVFFCCISSKVARFVSRARRSFFSGSALSFLYCGSVAHAGLAGRLAGHMSAQSEQPWTEAEKVAN